MVAGDVETIKIDGVAVTVEYTEASTGNVPDVEAWGVRWPGEGAAWGLLLHWTAKTPGCDWGAVGLWGIQPGGMLLNEAVVAQECGQRAALRALIRARVAWEVRTWN